jgi:hypothetical protein
MSEEYIVVSTVQGQFAEAQVRGFLEANGIPTEARGEALRKVLAISIADLGAVDILVPRDRADAARVLLAQADHGDLAISDDQ